jgi:hypothetical protein
MNTDFSKLKAKQVGALFGVSPQAVGLWAARDGCPRNPDKSFDLAAVIQWREDRIREETEIDNAEPSPLLDELRRVRIERETFNLQVARRDYLKAAEVGERWNRMARVFKNALIRMPRQLRMRLAGRDADEIEDTLSEYVSRTLNSLADGEEDDS